MQLGPILDWGLNINKKTVEVNTENFEQQRSYLKLIDKLSVEGSPYLSAAKHIYD